MSAATQLRSCYRSETVDPALRRAGADLHLEIKVIATFLSIIPTFGFLIA